MVIIQLKDDVDWCKANWVYRQLMADAINLNQNDDELKRVLTYGRAIGTLFVNQMQDPLKLRVLKALKQTSQQTLVGAIPGWNLAESDEAGRKMYFSSVRELLELILSKYPQLA